MTKEIKKYGAENARIRELVNDYQIFIQQTGSVPKEINEKLEMAIDNCMFNPKKAKRLSYLESLNCNSDDEIKEIEELREEEKKYFDKFCAKTMLDDLKAVIGEDNTLAVIRREKIRNVNGKKVSTDMNYIPIPFLQDPFNNANRSDVKIPTSVFRLQLKEDIADITNEKIIIMGFLSLCYDPYKKFYEIHHWKVTFKVVPKINVISNDFDSNDDEDLG